MTKSNKNGNNLSKEDDQQKTFESFFIEAIDTGCVWSLQNDAEGWALCQSEKYTHSSVMPFWSQPELAEVHLADDWQDYTVVAVSLEEFLDDWLTGMHTDELLVGINWDEELGGGEYEPLDILHAFENEYLS